MTIQRTSLIYRSIRLVILTIGILSAITINATANLPSSAKTVAELLRGSTTFTQNIEKFSYGYHAAFPQYSIPPYIQHKALAKNNAIYFSSKINHTLYSSVVSDSKTGRVISLQLTYVAPQMNTIDQPATSPVDQTEIDKDHTIAINYMAALFQWFNPTKSQDYCQKEIIRLLKVGKDEPLHEEIINNLRYVIVDHGEKGITLAVEPIKLANIN